MALPDDKQSSKEFKYWMIFVYLKESMQCLPHVLCYE